MKRERFDSLVPEFFCALGKLYAENPPFLWAYLFHIVQDLLRIFAYFQQLEDLEYGLDDLVSPLFEEFINNADNPKALRELVEELAKVRAYLKQELEFRGAPRPEEPV
jgi:hypothetical protein